MGSGQVRSGQDFPSFPLFLKIRSSQINSRFAKIFLFFEDQIRSEQVKIFQGFLFLKIKSRFDKILHFSEKYVKFFEDFPFF